VNVAQKLRAALAESSFFTGELREKVVAICEELERDGADDAYARCAEALGVIDEADGVGSAPGPVQSCLDEIERLRGRCRLLTELVIKARACGFQEYSADLLFQFVGDQATTIRNSIPAGELRRAVAEARYFAGQYDKPDEVFGVRLGQKIDEMCRQVVFKRSMEMMGMLPKEDERGGAA
jgi:hypothetical protein